MKSSFSNLPALKTPVYRHPIGYHTRCTRHSKILYFAPLEDKIFTYFYLKRFSYTILNSLMLISQRYTSFEGNCNKKFLLEFARLKNARGSASYRMSHTLHSPFQNSLLCALGRQDFYVFLLKTFLLYDSEQFDVNIIEIHFI